MAALQDTQAHQIGKRGHAGQVFKGTAELTFAQVDNGGKFVQRKGMRIIFLHIGDNRLQLFGECVAGVLTGRALRNSFHKVVLIKVIPEQKHLTAKKQLFLGIRKKQAV